jgi:hypothetical protein
MHHRSYGRSTERVRVIVIRPVERREIHRSGRRLHRSRGIAAMRSRLSRTDRLFTARVGNVVRWVMEGDPVVRVPGLVFLCLFVSGHTILQPSIEITLVTADPTWHMMTYIVKIISLTVAAFRAGNRSDTYPGPTAVQLRECCCIRGACSTPWLMRNPVSAEVSPRTMSQRSAVHTLPPRILVVD